jgi:hypothetical protein
VTSKFLFTKKGMLDNRLIFADQKSNFPEKLIRLRKSTSKVSYVACIAQGLAPEPHRVIKYFFKGSPIFIDT